MTRPAAHPDDLESADPEARLRGLSALVETPEMRALLKRLFEVARRDPDERVKQGALDLYGKVRDLMDGSRVMGAALETEAGALDERLVWRLLQQGRPDAKIDTLRVLAARRLTAAAPLLRRRLTEEDDPWVLATLVKALASLGGPEDVDALRPHLGHGDPRVRSNTAEALGMLGTPAALAAVRPHLASQDPRMRGVAALVMVQEDPEEALDTLQAMALAPDEAQKEAALYRLGKLRHGAARVILARMASREPDAGRRQRIHELLEVRRAVGALAWLRSEAGDPDLAAELCERVERVAAELGLDDAGTAEATARFQADSESSGLSQIAEVELGDEDEGDVLSRSAVFWGREGGALGELARQVQETARERKQAQLEAARAAERRRTLVFATLAVVASLLLGLFLGPGSPPPPRAQRPPERLRRNLGPPPVAPEQAREDLERAVFQAKVRETSGFNFDERWSALRTWLASRPPGTAPPITTRQLLDLRRRHLRGDEAAADDLQVWLTRVAEDVGASDSDATVASAPDASPSASPDAAPAAPSSPRPPR